MEYDYIIAGSGCAGLSLLYRILKDPDLRKKEILVIDRVTKTKNDRTWCYWEEDKGLFESIVHHEWGALEFLSSGVTKRFELERYRYKMIRGIDFYNFVLNFSNEFENVTFTNENVQQIDIENDCAFVLTEKAKYTSKFVFNSTNLFNPKIHSGNSLLQHFEGWVIKTKNPTFNSDVGTLMDFRISQKYGTTFMYVLPMASNEALVEYTLFSENVLDKNLYKVELQHYISKYLKIEQYEIAHKEFGIIPMSLATFSKNPKSEKRIINIGTAGGYTKASSGYTFQFIQRNTENIVRSLRKGNFPNTETTLRNKMFQWYDRTLLEVMISKKLTGKKIFTMLFEKVSPETILAFLDNDSTIIDDIKIMRSLPIKPFLIGGFKSLT